MHIFCATNITHPLLGMDDLTKCNACYNINVLQDDIGKESIQSNGKSLIAALRGLFVSSISEFIFHNTDAGHQNSTNF